MCALKIALEREEEVMDVYTVLKIGKNLVSLVVILKDYIPTREVKMDLSRCEVVGSLKSRSRADARTDNLDTISGEGGGAATLGRSPFQLTQSRHLVLGITFSG